LFSAEKGPNYAFDERGTCSECGKSRKEYDSRNDFLHHVGVCGTINEPMKSLKRSRSHFIEESRIIGYIFLFFFHFISLYYGFSFLSSILCISLFLSLFTADECVNKLKSGEMKIYDNGSQTVVDSCSVCGSVEGDESTENTDNPFIRCSICSSQLHQDCHLVGNPSDPPTAPVICSDCLKVGINEDNYRVTSSLSSGKWAFVYFPEEKWLKGVSMSVNPTDPTVVLMKFNLPENSGSSSSSSTASPTYRWINIEKMIVYPLVHQSSAATAGGDDDEENDDDTDQNEDLEISQPKRKRRRITDSTNGNDDNDGGNEMQFPSSPMKKNESRFITASSSPSAYHLPEGMTDTYVSANSLKAALCAAGTVCKGIDLVVSGENINAFACIRPPGKTVSLFVFFTELLSCFLLISWFPSSSFRSSLWSKWLYQRFIKYWILSIKQCCYCINICTYILGNTTYCYR
jgi:hypothetical protein